MHRPQYTEIPYRGEPYISVPWAVKGCLYAAASILGGAWRDSFERQQAELGMKSCLSLASSERRMYTQWRTICKVLHLSLGTLLISK